MGPHGAAEGLEAFRGQYALNRRPYSPFDVAESTRQRRGTYDLSRVNAARAPAHFRLDARVDRNATIFGKPLIVFFGVQNLTGRRNVSGFTWDRWTKTPDAAEQLGAFPLVGLGRKEPDADSGRARVSKPETIETRPAKTLGIVESQAPASSADTEVRMSNVFVRSAPPMLLAFTACR